MTSVAAAHGNVSNSNKEKGDRTIPFRNEPQAFSNT